MAVPYTFGTATSSIPLSQLDSNFNTVITLGNTAIQLGNTVTTLNNMTLANVTISSGNVTITNVAVTTANVTTANITTAVIGTETVTTSTITTANVTTANITTDNITNGTVITSLTLSYGTANGVAYLNGSKVLTTGSALSFDGTNLLNTAGVFSSTSATGGTGYVGAIGTAMRLVNLNASSSTQIIGNGQIDINTAGGYPIVFTTSSSERARIDSSGNLGLGVTPSAWNTLTTLQIKNASVSGFVNTTYLSANAYYSSGWKYLVTDTSARYEINTSGQHQWFNAPSGTAGNAITFTQAMTLDASGNLLVGTTSSTTYTGNSVIVAQGGASPGGANISVNHISGSSSGNYYLGFNLNGTGIGSITQSGTTAVLYNVTSDQRLKENIVDAPEFGSVIDSLQVRSFDWKTDNTHQRAGFIAQELVNVAPEAVHQPVNEEDMMAVDYSKLVPMLVKEIQSLRKRLADAGIA